MTDIEELKVEIRLLKERIIALEARPVGYPPCGPGIYPSPWFPNPSPTMPYTIGDPPYPSGPTCVSVNKPA